jgi:hypothetical protein
MRDSYRHWICCVVLTCVPLLGCGGFGSSPSANSGTNDNSSSDPNDGSKLAPAGPAQHPNLLTTYITRPAWRAAGVGYAVGYPAGMVLKNPSTLSLTGVAVDATAHRITVAASNITLEGFDFSINGGWTINIIAAANISIKNCKFALTAAFGSFPAVMSDVQSPGLYLGYNVIDGGGGAVTAMNPNTLISMGAGGTLEYNWFKNSPADAVTVSALPSGSSVTIQYNLFENAGQLANTDGNYIRLGIGIFSSLNIVYNTTYQAPGGQLGTGGFDLIPANASANAIANLVVSHNTMVTSGTPPTVSFLLATNPAQTTVGQIHDNFADVSGALAFMHSGSNGPNVVYTNNINLVSGNSL